MKITNFIPFIFFILIFIYGCQKNSNKNNTTSAKSKNLIVKVEKEEFKNFINEFLFKMRNNVTLKSHYNDFNIPKNNLEILINQLSQKGVLIGELEQQNATIFTCDTVKNSILKRSGVPYRCLSHFVFVANQPDPAMTRYRYEMNGDVGMFTIETYYELKFVRESGDWKLASCKNINPPED